MINTLYIDDFTDITTITVDKTKPANERLKQYIDDVKNPYTVKVGDMLVRIEFTGTKDFSDALTAAFS